MPQYCSFSFAHTVACPGFVRAVVELRISRYNRQTATEPQEQSIQSGAKHGRLPKVPAAMGLICAYDVYGQIEVDA